MNSAPEKKERESITDEIEQRLEELEHKLKLAEDRVEHMRRIRDLERADDELIKPPRGDNQ